MAMVGSGSTRKRYRGEGPPACASVSPRPAPRPLFQHRPATQLASKLVELSPPGINKVFLCDSGSVSVEVAIKMAVQYWHQKVA